MRSSGRRSHGCQTPGNSHRSHRSRPPACCRTEGERDRRERERGSGREGEREGERGREREGEREWEKERERERDTVNPGLHLERGH